VYRRLDRTAVQRMLQRAQVRLGVACTPVDSQFPIPDLLRSALPRRTMRRRVAPEELPPPPAAAGLGAAPDAERKPRQDGAGGGGGGGGDEDKEDLHVFLALLKVG
jgi:hypothetical protein